MKNLKDLKELALYAAKKQVPTEFANQTVADVNDALRAELKENFGTYNLYRRNKLDLFEIMQETMDIIMPKEVEAMIQMFAEVRNYPNGAKPQFKVKKGKTRAKQFATRAAASGVYETFRLDSDVIDVKTFAIGDAAYIDFERFLSGEEDWADYMEALTAGMLHAIYVEIFNCLVGAATEVGGLSKYGMKVVDSQYNADNFKNLINKVKLYGNGAIVFAFPEFINKLPADEIVKGYNGDNGAYKGIYSPADIEAIANIGRVQQFRGTPIVELPQSLVDEKNKKVVFNPACAFILPTGGEKVVKVAFEGDTIVKDWENRDNSMEIQAYKKMGTAILHYNNWGIYKNNSIDSVDVNTLYAITEVTTTTTA